MKTIHTHTLELSGSSYEAGRLLGSRLASVPSLKTVSYTHLTLPTIYSV